MGLADSLGKDESGASRSAAYRSSERQPRLAGAHLTDAVDTRRA
jgi:hypothetical protein